MNLLITSLERLFGSLIKSSSRPLTSTFGPCKSKAKFADSVKVDFGTFERHDRTVFLKTDSKLLPLTTGTPTACIATVAKGNSEYLLGEIEVTLAETDYSTFFQNALSQKNIPKPSWFSHPFSHKKYLKAWRHQTAQPVFYELSDEYKTRYNSLMNAGVELANSPGKYFDITEHRLDTMDLVKRNAGARRLLERNYLQISNTAPPSGHFNFAPLCFHEHLRSIYFLPDTVFVAGEGSNYFFPYHEVRLDVGRKDFITEEVPYGVQPVDYTWQYVNRDGGPDRRFNDNFQIPIINVTELDFYFSSGLQVHTAFTSATAANKFAKAFAKLGTSV